MDLAKPLKLPAISAIEFGVAGGRGFDALERAAKAVGKYFGIQISVFGFDTGKRDAGTHRLQGSAPRLGQGVALHPT